MRIACQLTEYIHGKAELPHVIDTEEAIRQIIEIHSKQGGATFSLYFGNVAGQPIYAVSVFNNRTKYVSDSNALASFLRRFIRVNWDLLTDPRNTVGTWHEVDTDVVWLDVTSTLEDRELAEQLGRQYNQCSIYNLATGDEIDTGGTGEELPGWPPEAERLPAFVRSDEIAKNE